MSDFSEAILAIIKIEDELRDEIQSLKEDLEFARSQICIAADSAYKRGMDNASQIVDAYAKKMQKQAINEDNKPRDEGVSLPSKWMNDSFMYCSMAEAAIEINKEIQSSLEGSQ